MMVQDQGMVSIEATLAVSTIRVDAYLVERIGTYLRLRKDGCRKDVLL